MNVKKTFLVFLVLSLLLMAVPWVLENSEHRYVSGIKKEYEGWKSGEGWDLSESTLENIKDISVRKSKVEYNNWITYPMFALGYVLLACDVVYISTKIEVKISGSIGQD